MRREKRNERREEIEKTEEEKKRRRRNEEKKEKGKEEDRREETRRRRSEKGLALRVLPAETRLTVYCRIAVRDRLQLVAVLAGERVSIKTGMKT